MRTALLLDVSLSVPMGDWFDAAKAIAMRVASQLQEDHLLAGVTAFSEEAWQVPADQLASVPYSWSYGSNISAALLTGLEVLNGPGRLVLICALEPTAHSVEGSSLPYFAYPPAPASIDATIVAFKKAAEGGVVVEALQTGGWSTNVVETMVAEIEATGGQVRRCERGQETDRTDDLLRTLRSS